MKIKNNIKDILIILMALLLICILVLIYFTGREDKKTVTKVGIVLTGSVTDEGWNGLHYKGLMSASEKFDDVKIITKENILENTGECEKAVKELIDDNVKIIILSSFSYADEIYDLIKDNPDVTFFSESGETDLKNVSSYFTRMYQGRYLAGIVAGMTTKSNKIGYVAAMENSEVNRGINAFTLGVKKANPDATVYVKFTESWDDAETEKENTKTLIAEGIDVVTYHQNQKNVIDEAEAEGVYSIGYHEVAENSSDMHLGAVVSDWKIVYEELLKNAIQGRGNAEKRYWLGIENDAVDFDVCSAEVSADMKTAIEYAKNDILAGNDVFSGVIYDNEGNIRCQEDSSLSDEKILSHMDWFVEGVVIE